MARPREFDPDDAIAAIKDVFWRQGFEGTSLQDIEAATGLNKQSLYRVYKDKKDMYLASLKKYDAEEVAAAASLLAADGTAQERFARLFQSVLRDYDERGCFLCNASADISQIDEVAREHVFSAIARIESVFRETLKASPPYREDAGARRAMAAKLLAFYFGVRVLIKTKTPLAVIKSAVKQVISEIQ